ncbi:MAG: hypothetical protein P9M08_08435 [Candidatus Erginobacter occultus]|nr:hypothetical protein [Candidatus Erginobacter occultus]
MKNTETIDDALRAAVIRIVRRGIRLGRKKGRTITLARSSAADPVDIRELDPETPEGRERLEKMIRGRTNYYTFAGLGKLSEKSRIHWTALNRPLWQRGPISCLMLGAMLLRGGRLKNRIYRLAGVRIGKDTEIMQAAWIDHFCPELVEIGEGNLIGAFCKISSHAYEGGGRFRIGLVKIGDNCLLASGVSLAAIRIGDGTRVLPNATLSPFFVRLHKNSVVTIPPPIVTRAPENSAVPAAPSPGEEPADMVKKNPRK